MDGFIALLATFNKATVTAVVNWISTNVLLLVFHLQVGAEWQQLAATLLFAVIHGLIVYATPNKVKTADGSFVTVDHNVIAANAAGKAMAPTGLGRHLWVDDFGSSAAGVGIVIWIVFLIGLIIAGLYGWVHNIMLLAAGTTDPLTLMEVLRGVGIVFAPLGVVLGYIN